MKIFTAGIATTKTLNIANKSRKVVFTLFLLILAANTHAQAPVNDDPCNAITLTAANSCTFQIFDNFNATGSAGVPAPGCANYQGGDVWFKTTVTCTGSLVINTESGSIFDGGMAAYSGSCNNLTLISCDDDGSSDGAMPKLTLTGLSPNTEIWIRLWEKGGDQNGSFGICVSIPPPPPAGGNCLNALPFCTSNVYTFPNATNVPSLGGNGIYGCLGSTPNPVWYYMQAQTAGDIIIGISQSDNSGNGIDVDYAVWGPFSSLQVSCPNLTAANNISCSFSPAPTETATILNAQVGDFYILLLTNFDDLPGTITFQQSGGTGSTNCAVICNVTASNSGPVCPGGTFNLTATAVPNGVYSWTGPNCYSSSLQNPGTLTAPTTPGTYTYTLTVTTPSGSQCTSSTNVVVASAITGTASSANTSCTGVSDGTITVTPTPAGTYSYTLNPGAITQANPTFTGVGAGNYSVTITSGAGCTGTVSNINVTPGAALTGTFVKNDASCNGISDGSVTVTPSVAGTYTYTLNPGAVTQSAPTFTGLTAGPYTVTFTNGAGCQGTVTGINISPGPNLLTVVSYTNTTCNGANDGSVTLTPVIPGPHTFTLYPPDITQSSGTFTGLSAGVNYFVIYTNAAGCIGSPGGFQISAGPSITATSVKTNTTCAQVNDGSITITPSQPGTYSYTLNPGAITQASATFTGLAPNTYSVTFTHTSGCQGTLNNIVVSAGAAPSGTATTTSTSCPGVSNGTITVTPAATGPYIFNLNPGNISQASPVFTGLSAGTYTITYVTAGGCAGQIPVNPVIAPGVALSSTFTPANPPCANINNGSLTINAGGTAPHNFTLTGAGGPYVQSNPVFSNLQPGTYNYSFTDATGCTGTAGPIVLTTNSPLAASVTKLMPRCNANSNGSITLAASGGVAPYRYSLDNGVTYQGPVFNGLPAGAYTIRIRDNVGCTKDTTVTLNQPPALTASAVTNNATCNGNDGTIIITAGGGTNPYQYSIDNGATYLSNATITAPAAGPYSTIRVKDANGCVTGTNATVNYTDNMFLTLTGDTTLRQEQFITLQPQTNPATNIFQWTPAAGLSSDTVKNPVASPTETLTYVLTASYGPCTRQATVEITVLKKPIPEAGPPVTICNMDSTVLVGSAGNLSGSVNYVWSPANEVGEDSAATTIALPGSSSQQYVLTVTDNYGCNFSVQDSILVTVQPPVPAFAGNDTIAVPGVPHQLRATGGNYYIWNPATPLSSPFSPNPLATLTNDTKFTVLVTDIAGCKGYDTVFIKVYQGPAYHIPNAFTPNGDGLNDVFRPIPAGIAKTEYFRIFNRYGQLVFETNQWLKGWDGTFKGKRQTLGNYVWIIKGTDKYGASVDMKGSVMLLP